MSLAQDDFEINVPPSQTKTRVRIRFYPADQARFALAEADELAIRIIANGGGLYIITAKSKAP
jgi:hypothetical protein